jgi:hypothetical protein
MPKISELSDPGSSHNLTGQEKIVAVTASLSTISLSASDLVGRSIDNIATGSVSNFKATHTDFNANSGKYESVYSNVNANSAEYESVYSTLLANSADYTYVASNSATLQADTTILGTLSTQGTLSGGNNLIIQNRGTIGGDHIVTDNVLTVFGNISAQGTIYASGSALSDVDPVNPGGSNRTIQYNDSNAFGGAAQFAYDEVNHNVGIGTQAIAIDDNIHEKLTVAGNISATGKIYNEDGELGQVTPGGADGAIQFNNSSTLSGNANLTFDDTNVRLGIGVSPTQTLQTKQTGFYSAFFERDGGSAATQGWLKIGMSELGSGGADALLDAKNSIGFRTNGASTPTIGMKIDSSQNVGIGTVSPSDYYSSANNLVIASNTNAGMTIKTGTSANGWLIFADGTSSGDNTRGAVSYEHATNNMKFRVDNDVKMIILSSSNVGIGVDNPGEKLSVLGSISASSALKGTTLGIGTVTVATLSAGDVSTVGVLGIGVDNPAYKLHVAAPNTSTIAISAFGEIHAGGDIVSSSSSDKRQKTNIKKLDNALDKVLTLDGVEYDWNELAAAHRIGKHDVGVIAQQVEEVLPDAVEHRENGMMAVRYERIIPLLIESIKELKSEIDELKGK